ncbi:MAG: response regulator [Kiloniellales bacterium]|nr:response regulator [Kiloniellales bacterium]
MTDAQPQPARPHVLIVEDELLVSELIAEALAEAGVKSSSAAYSLSEAWSLVERVAFDAAVLDVNVRGDMTAALAEDLRRRGVPIVFVSGYVDWSEHQSRFPGVTLLRKPFRVADLAAAVEALLARGG